MPKTKQRPRPESDKMPAGFYLKRGIWYTRIYKPNPLTGKWGMSAESTRCKKDDGELARQYVERRDRELGNAQAFGQDADPGKVTVSELLDDFLDASATNQRERSVLT